MKTLTSKIMAHLLLSLSLLFAYHASHAQYDIFIMNTNKSSCYKKGEVIEIAGRGFGNKKTNKSLVIRDNTKEYILNDIQLWSPEKIVAVLPNRINIAKKNNFTVGIRVGSIWASNRNKNITFCYIDNTITPLVTLKPQLRTILPNRVIPERDKPTKTKEPITRKPTTKEPGPNIPTNTKDDSTIKPHNSTVTISTSIIPQPTTPPSSTGNIRGTASLKGLQAPPTVEFDLNANKNKEQQEPKEVMVVSASMKDAIQLAELVKQYNIRIKRRSRYSSLNIVVSILAIPQNLEAIDIIEQLREYDPTLWVDVNHRYQLLGDASKDPKQWAYQKVGWSQFHVECGQDLKMGIIDTGIAHDAPIDHKHIIAKSFVPNGIQKANPDHGTAIGSLLLGSPHKKIIGLTPRATIYSAAIFRTRNKKHIDTTAEYIISALNWLASENVTVINMSLGGPRNLPVELAIKTLTAQGFTIFAAAGIDDNNAPLYPAAQNEVFAVRAIDLNNTVFKKEIKGNYIAFSAPGVDLWLLNATGKGRYLSGSSFATPFAAASYLLLNKNKNNNDLSPIEQLITLSLDLGAEGRDPSFGFGLIHLPDRC